MTGEGEGASTPPARQIQPPVPAPRIAALVHHAFGPAVALCASHAVTGGEINTVYRLTLAGPDGQDRASRDVMLRIAPPPDAPLHWHEEALMRREHAIAPSLAPLGPLLPRTLFVDFTRQQLPRDYLFQTAMPGENWRAIEGELSAAASDALWRELAGISLRLQAIQGDAFGYPPPFPSFATWSACVAWELEHVIADLERIGEETSAPRAILSYVRAHPEPLDALRTPRLAHGDLWTFNVLVARGSDAGATPHITAVLDGDRAYWGDPLADWTFHLLPRKASERVREVFWQTYGPREQTPEAARRWTIYEAKHTGNVLAIAARAGAERVVAEARAHLARYASELSGANG